MNNKDIQKELRSSCAHLERIINGLENIDIRNSDLDITTNMFEFMDKIAKIEIELYNYLRERRIK